MAGGGRSAVGSSGWRLQAKARGIHAASVGEVRGFFEKVDAVGWWTLKRRERRGPGGGLWAVGVEGAMGGLGKQPQAKERGIHAASVGEVREFLEKADALGWRTLTRRERRGPRGWFLGFGGGRQGCRRSRGGLKRLWDGQEARRALISKIER